MRFVPLNYIRKKRMGIVIASSIDTIKAGFLNITAEDIGNRRLVGRKQCKFPTLHYILE